MTREQAACALAEIAAWHIAEASVFEGWARAGRQADLPSAQAHASFAAESREKAGACVAAINQLHGVSPE